MKVTAIISAVIAVPALAFFYWGFYTPQGQLAYDEMDGLYPLGSGVLGFVALVIFLLMMLIMKLRAKLWD